MPHRPMLDGRDETTTARYVYREAVTALARENLELRDELARSRRSAPAVSAAVRSRRSS